MNEDEPKKWDLLDKLVFTMQLVFIVPFIIVGIMIISLGIINSLFVLTIIDKFKDPNPIYTIDKYEVYLLPENISRGIKPNSSFGSIGLDKIGSSVIKFKEITNKPLQLQECKQSECQVRGFYGGSSARLAYTPRESIIIQTAKYQILGHITISNDIIFNDIRFYFTNKELVSKVKNRDHLSGQYNLDPKLYTEFVNLLKLSGEDVDFFKRIRIQNYRKKKIPEEIE
ncbi:MAG: hypothetical protein SFU98_06320 [Leptospiraceae bacterium]|nr:hypothetical protein [Leptospiraceae bacterium]